MMAENDPKIFIQFPTLSLHSLKISQPFPLQDLMQITAEDYLGNDITSSLVIGNNEYNTAIPGTYHVPVSVIDSEGNAATTYVVVNILSNDQAKQTLPKIYKNVQDVYVEQTNIKNPYNLKDPSFIKITAIDQSGYDISRRVMLKTKRINYEVPGIYIALIIVIDGNGNLSLSSFKVHVLSQQQAYEMEHPVQQELPETPATVPTQETEVIPQDMPNPEPELPVATEEVPSIARRRQLPPAESYRSTSQKTPQPEKQRNMTAFIAGDLAILAAVIIPAWILIFQFG